MISCAICGNKTAKEVTSERTIHLLGRDETFERREFTCGSCGESFTDDEQGLENEAAERKATCRALASIGGKEIRLLREMTGVTQAEFENVLGLGRNTIARWETAQRPLPSYIKTMVRLLALNPTALLVLRDQELAVSERMELPFGGTIKANAVAPPYVPFVRQAVAPRPAVPERDEAKPDFAKVLRLNLPEPKRPPWSEAKEGSSHEYSR